MPFAHRFTAAGKQKQHQDEATAWRQRIDALAGTPNHARDSIVLNQRLAAANTPVDLFIAMFIIKGSEAPAVAGLRRPEAEAKIREASLAVGRVSPMPRLARPGPVVEQYVKPQPGVPAPQSSAADLVVAE